MIKGKTDVVTPQMLIRLERHDMRDDYLWLFMTVLQLRGAAYDLEESEGESSHTKAVITNASRLIMRLKAGAYKRLRRLEAKAQTLQNQPGAPQ